MGVRPFVVSVHYRSRSPTEKEIAMRARRRAPSVRREDLLSRHPSGRIMRRLARVEPRRGRRGADDRVKNRDQGAALGELGRDDEILRLWVALLGHRLPPFLTN